MESIIKVIEDGKSKISANAISYALEEGVVESTPKTKREWERVIYLISEAIKDIAINCNINKKTKINDFEKIELDAFLELEIKTHQYRGVSLWMFLSLLKCFRKAYLNYLADSRCCQKDGIDILNRIFDLLEIKFCEKWEKTNKNTKLITLRKAINTLSIEKYKYQKVFDGIDYPCIVTKGRSTADLINKACIDFWVSNYEITKFEKEIWEFTSFQKKLILYHQLKDLSFLVPFLCSEFIEFLKSNEKAMCYEREIRINSKRNHYEIRFCKLEDVRTKLEYSLISLFPIDERISAQDKIVKKEKEARILIEKAPDGVFIVDENGRYIEVNDAACKMTGYCKKELLKMWIGDLPYDDISVPLAGFEKLKKEGYLSADYQFLRKNREKIWVSLTAVKIEETKYLGFCKDITEKKMVQDDLHEAKERYKVLFEQANSAIVVLDLLGSILMINTIGAAYLNSELQFLIGKKFASFFPGFESKIIAKIDHVKTHGEPVSFEARWNIRQKPKWLMTSIQPIKNQNGEIKKIQIVSQDISVLKQAEEMRLALEKRRQYLVKNESLTRMANAIGHHFNNMFTVILGNLELVRNSSSYNLKFENNFSQIERAVEKSNNICSQIMAYWSHLSDKLVLIDLNNFCQNFYQHIQKKIPTNIRIDYMSIQEILYVKGREDKLSLILEAFLNNAIEAIESPHGDIKFSVYIKNARKLKKSKIYPLDFEFKNESYACLSIQDNGKGIKKIDFDKLFDPFFSKKEFGRGLGLSNALGTVIFLDGAIAVESKIGQGSEFSLVLPLVENDNLAKKESKIFVKAKKQNDNSILVVDDDEIVLKMEAILIETLGYATTKVASGEEAIKLIRKNPNGYDVVICDLHMPNIDGLETFAKIKEISPDIKFVLTSGHHIPKSLNDNKQPAPDAILQKPYRLERLKKVISMLIP
jgi:PAS domain S-box-containing protein